mgnify:FL=1
MKTSPKQKVTLSLDVQVYETLIKVAGKRGIGVYVNNLVLSRFPSHDSLEAGYQALALYEEKDQESKDWLDASIDAPIED